jgi:glycosyltransferase involved in cell wall biosynthesis
VDHRDLKGRLRECHVFAFPSIREFGGGVVLEAMAMGLLPIVVDYGGPGELVTPETGFALPMCPPAELMARLRATLGELVAHPERIRPVGARARERVLRTFTWDAKAEQLLAVYDWALGRAGKPDFGMPLRDAA